MNLQTTSSLYTSGECAPSTETIKLVELKNICDMVTESQQKKMVTNFEMSKTPAYSVIKDRHTLLHQGLEGIFSL